MQRFLQKSYLGRIEVTFILNLKIMEFHLWLSGLRTHLVSMRMQVQSLALLSGLRIQHCCKCNIGSRYSSDLAWPWHTPAAAVLIPPSWELPYATGVALKRKKNHNSLSSKFNLYLGILDVGTRKKVLSKQRYLPTCFSALSLVLKTGMVHDGPR